MSWREGPLWVTGATGFVGGHLLAALSEAGVPALGTSRHPQPGQGWLHLPAGDAEALTQALRRQPPSALIHLAGFASVGRSFAEPEACWEGNVQAAVPLLHALAQHAPHCRTLVISSGEVYGPARSLAPDSPYGASKLALEALALQVGRSSGLPVLVARAFNQVGPGQAEHFALPSWAEQIARAEVGRGPSQLVVGNLEARRDFVDVRDVAQAYMLLLDQGTPGTVVDVGLGRSRSMEDALQTLLAQAKVGLSVRQDPQRLRPVDATERLADPSALLALGWRPQHAFEDSLAGVLAEARARQPWVGDASASGLC